MLGEYLTASRGELGAVVLPSTSDREAFGDRRVGQRITEGALGDVIPDAVVVEAELFEQRDARLVAREHVGLGAASFARGSQHRALGVGATE